MWIVVYCVVVEIEQDGSEEEFICIFVEVGIDIKLVIDDRCIVFIVVCEYRNYRFIDFLLDNY